ncbi:ATP-binding protein [Massilia eburnea]|uniref:ATP-binding protein n=1 Tax=Massilia eburnea TaxID=1776165 RepID=UPI003D6AC201
MTTGGYRSRCRCPAGVHAEIIISDDGAGIASGHLNRIFDPFFTTRMSEGSSGTGTEHRAQHSHHRPWRQDPRRQQCPARGTTFRITIPLDAPMHHEEPIIPRV